MYQHTLFGPYINAIILLFLQRVLLLVASDVDALCACKILQVSLGSFSLQYEKISVPWDPINGGELGNRERFKLLL